MLACVHVAPYLILHFEGNADTRFHVDGAVPCSQSHSVRQWIYQRLCFEKSYHCRTPKIRNKDQIASLLCELVNFLPFPLVGHAAKHSQQQFYYQTNNTTRAEVSQVSQDIMPLLITLEEFVSSTISHSQYLEVLLEKLQRGFDAVSNHKDKNQTNGDNAKLCCVCKCSSRGRCTYKASSGSVTTQRFRP